MFLLSDAEGFFGLGYTSSSDAKTFLQDFTVLIRLMLGL
ncbi:hypothetical protein OROGR_011718 [Orobanche gracilis]